MYAIVAAAGRGKRFSRSQDSEEKLPKQFLRVHNKPIILYSLAALQNCRAADFIIVSANKQHFEFIRGLSSRNKISKLMQITEGGKTRFDSVRKAFNQIHADKNDLIMVHDAVRPAVDEEDFHKIIDEAKDFDCVTYALKINDTVKKSSGNYISGSVSRENLWLIQTPQVFRYEVLASAYRKARGKKFSDESSLAENAGYRVRIIEGKRGNIKVTTSGDLEFMFRSI